MRHKKAQAAVEFLTTYGWAILFLIIIISFAFYSGYFNIDRYLQTQCIFSPNFQCATYKFVQINSNNLTLVFQASNGLGFDIYFANGSALLLAENIGKTGKTNYTGTCYRNLPYSQLVRPGDLITCVINITNAEVVPTIGKNLNLQVKLNYTNCNTAPNYAKTGNCSGGSVYELSGSIRTPLEQKVTLAQYCGDGICNRTILENYFTCPVPPGDCPAPVCPNAKCEYLDGENYFNCPKDCCDSDCTNATDSICHSSCSGFGIPTACSSVQNVCESQTLNAQMCSNASGGTFGFPLQNYTTCCS